MCIYRNVLIYRVSLYSNRNIENSLIGQLILNTTLVDRYIKNKKVVHRYYNCTVIVYRNSKMLSQGVWTFVEAIEVVSLCAI